MPRFNFSLHEVKTFRINEDKDRPGLVYIEIDDNAGDTHTISLWCEKPKPAAAGPWGPSGEASRGAA